MTRSYRSRITRLEKEIADLDRDAAMAAKREADLIRKISRAQDAANRATNMASARSRVRELEQASKSVADNRKKQSDISARRAEKSKSLHDYQERQARADETNRKRVEGDQRKLMRDSEAHQRRMTLATRRQDRANPTLTSQGDSASSYDFFICHASEDKEDFVRELAGVLRASGATVWYDEFTLRIGSRLRREIDRGLVNSKFGIVIVSEHFFAKEWPQRELDGLISLDAQDQSRILPIWYKVTKDEVARRSPTLADIVALNAGVQSIDSIAEELLELLK